MHLNSASYSPPPFASYASNERNSANGERMYSRVARSMKDIWAPKDVANAMRSLPGGEALWSALEADRELFGSKVESSREAAATFASIEEALSQGHGETALLICACCALSELIERLLVEYGVNPNTMDADGRTPLHLASCAADRSSIDILLKYGGNVNVWDHAQKATPLHCSACAGSLACIKLLLKAGADVNSGLLKGQTALYHAVKFNSVECVEELLQAGANPNSPQVFSETPLHVAAAFGLPECLRLLLKGGADIRARFDTSKVTSLHLAAQDGNVDCVRILLEAGADIGSENHKRQTPLHLAALAQSMDTIEVLLQKGANTNALDEHNRTPLHCAIVKECHSTECIRALLNKGANVNCADAFGYTPLHLAALHEFSSCVGLLINAGADVMARTNGGVSALTFVVRRTPETLPCFFERLDSSVILHDHDLGDADCELRLDFRVLLPPPAPSNGAFKNYYERRVESALLLGFIEVGMRHLLKHPLCETFLLLKWRKIRKYFLISLAFQLCFVVFNTSYTVGVFYEWNHNQNNKIDIVYVAAGFILMVLNVIFLAKEIFGIAHGWLRYVMNWENWIKVFVVSTVFVCHGTGNYYYDNINPYQRHVAAVGIVFTWAHLMILIGRFPTFGVYVQMFTTVSINFSKFLFAYCCLFIGFGLGLGLLLQNFSPYQYPHFALLKSFIMMSGELEYEDLFHDDKTIVKYPGTAHILFLAYVIFVTVILTNLLVGLAVSDIQGLQKTARLNRLVRQAELVAHIESILFSRIFHKIFPSAFLKHYLKSALMVPSTPYNRFIHIRPNDPRERRVPRHLIDGAYNLVASRSGCRTRVGEAGPGSRKDAYKTWAMQYSLRSRGISEEDEMEEMENMVVPPTHMLKFLSSQMSLLAEAREMFSEELKGQIENMKKTMECFSLQMTSHRLDGDKNSGDMKKITRMSSAPALIDSE